MVNTNAAFNHSDTAIPNVESAGSYVNLRDFTIDEDALWSP
jgi:hypothetical protein